MNFLEITEKEYLKYWENHPNKAFLSSPKIAQLRKKQGWNVYYVAEKEENNILVAAMLLAHKRHFGVYEFYSPRGFLMNFSENEKSLKLIKIFTEDLKKFIKEKHGYILRIDPYVINKERDIDGNIVENGVDNSKIKEKLLSLGYKEVPQARKEQVGWMFSLNLKGKTEEDILKEMKPGTRNTIRKAEKLGINVREISCDELPEFYNIMEETSKRKGFSNRKLSYYQEMYKLFHDSKEVKYFITSLDLNKYRNNLKKEKEEKEKELNMLNDAKYNDGKKKSLIQEIESIDKRITDAEAIIEKENREVINLSGSMFMLIKPEIIYLSSGNYEEYLKFNSQYLIQWELIKYGIKHGFDKHNFYGIPENINTHPKDYGIYEFKRGFNGYVEELIGEYELPIRYHYNLFNFIHKVKDILKSKRS